MRIAGDSSLLRGGADLFQFGLQKVSRNAGQHQQKFVSAIADEQVRRPDAGLDGVCHRFQCHISGVMPVGIVADLEIIHIHQRDACRADGFAGNFFVIAAVVNSCQRIPIKLVFELLLPCSTLPSCFVLRCFLIFGQSLQRLLRCGKSRFLSMKLFQQLLLTRFVIFLDLGRCIHVLTLFYIICVFHLRKRAFPLFFNGGGG